METENYSAPEAIADGSGTENKNTGKARETKKSRSSRKKDNFSIEDAFGELDQLIDSMKSDGITLEESFASYQKGMELLKKCSAQIDLIEKKVELLNSDGTTSVSEELSDVR